jgi:hypothetical protein
VNPWVLGGGVLAALLLLGRRASAAVMPPSFGGDATLLWRGGSYRVTSTDRLWLLRAVQSESNKPSDRKWVAQTLINRFVYLRAKGNTVYPTLTSFVRAYAQPINPLWQSADTDKCRRYPSRCTPRMLEKRRLSRTRTQFDDSTVIAVDEALGGMTIPSSSVHYAAPGIGASGKIKLTADRQGYNTFYAVSASRSWPGYSVA